MEKQRGFTLIELLVVVAIIGMLSSVVLASMNTARQKARDARRLSDARALMTALELYYSSNTAYPGTAGQVSDVLTALTPEHITQLPSDPAYSGAEGYLYGTSNTLHGYAIAVQQEQTGWCQFIEGSGYSSWSTETYPLCSR